jgi:hypothetical protein
MGSKFRGKEYDLDLYLTSSEIECHTFDLCQELGKLSDEAICQLWDVLQARGTVETMLDEAYWEGYEQGQKEIPDNKDSHLLICSNDQLIGEIRKRLEVTER